MALMIVQDSETLFQPAPGVLDTAVVSGPDQRLQVSDGQGVLATLTVGAKTVAMRGPTRTFAEQKKPFLDEFQRTTTNELGQSPGGGTWRNLIGTDAKFSCDGSKGLILMDAANTSRWCSLFDDDVADVNARALVTVSEVPTGASCSISLSWGYSDSSNNYRARLLITTAGNVQLAMEKEVGGTVTNLGALTTIGTGFTAGDLWHIRAQRAGNTVRCRAWKNGTSEPGTWLHTATDTAHMTGRLGIRSIASTGNTNIPYNAELHELAAESCQWANPPTVTHDTWVRVLDEPFDGTWSRALDQQIRRWAGDNSPDALAYAMMFGAYALPVTDPRLTGTPQVFGQAQYGPLQPDGTRYEFSDWNDYIGMDWDYDSGEHRDFPHGNITISGCIDCSGFVRSVYGRHLGIPLTFDTDFDGLNLPRRTMDIGPSGPGVIVAQGVGTPPALTSIQVGDVVLFDADFSEPTEGQIDHNGIYLGLDANGDYRFISSRKVANGPTFGDLGGPSLISGGGTYATRLRIIRRF